MPDSPTAIHASTPTELRERIEAERRGAPFLVYRDVDGRQQLFDLVDAKRLSLGRKPDNDIVLDWDRGVSRVHAELELVGGEWTVIDDGLSQNGTYVNEERVTGRRRIHDGDMLRLGDTRIVFSAPFERHTGQTSALASTAPEIASLTATQKAVLVALCRPFRHAGSFATPATNKEIAAELHFELDTVKGHLRVLFQKFGIGDVAQNQKRAQLVWRAFQTGVVTPRDLWPAGEPNGS
jgi:hypothetical protein